MSTIQKNVNEVLYEKINELEKRIEQNENKKKKFINYNKIKYLIFNNKCSIINLFLLFINLYLLYLEDYNHLRSRVEQVKILRFCQHKDSNWFLQMEP